MPSAFDAFADAFDGEPSVIDEILDNLVLLFKEDERMASWHQGRVGKSHSGIPIDSFGYPQVVWSVQTIEDERRVGGCTDLQATMEMIVAWVEPVDLLSEQDTTVATFAEYAKGLVMSNLKSEAPIRRIIPNGSTRGASFALTDLVAVPHEEQDSATIYVSFNLNLTAKINTFTREKR